MADEVDRVAMVSDLVALEKRLEKRLEERLTARFDERLDTRLTERMKSIEQRIKDEGETTRRHFDIMVEKVQDAVKIVAEVNAHHAVVLDDHEHRLRRVEGTR